MFLWKELLEKEQELWYERLYEFYANELFQEKALTFCLIVTLW